MQVKDHIQEVLISDYKKILKENAELKREMMKLKLENDTIKKALKVLAQEIDDTCYELGFRETAVKAVKNLIGE